MFTMGLLESCSPLQEVKAEPKQMDWGQKRTHKNAELVVRLCQNTEIEQLTSLFQNNGISIIRQVSPTLVIVTWHDARNIHEITSTLQHSTSVCGAQENMLYQMMRNQ